MYGYIWLIYTIFGKMKLFINHKKEHYNFCSVPFLC